MSQVSWMQLRAIAGILFAAAAGPAAANTFAVSPNISGGFGHYKWNIGVDGAAATGNPVLVVMTGQTYTFNVTTTAIHPFWIDYLPGLGGSVAAQPYPVGPDLSGNGLAASGSITLNLPADAPDTLHYACGNHSEMSNSITVVHDLVFRSNFD